MGSKVIRNITKVFRSASGVLFGRSTAGTGRGEEITFASIPALIGVYTTAQVDSIIGGIEGLTSADIDTLAEINAILTDADLASISYVDSGLSAKQATLVSGTNIKTVNGSSLLGSGDLSTSLTEVTITDAAVTMTANRRYVGSIAAFTADRQYKLPAGTAGDVIEVHILAGDDTYELILIGDTGVSINGGTTATEWSRLFISNELVRFRCHATNDWRVDVDGRIRQQCLLSLATTVSSNFANNAYTRVPYDTSVADNASIGSIASDQIVPRRGGTFEIVSFAQVEGITSANIVVPALNVAGVRYTGQIVITNASLSSGYITQMATVFQIAAGDVVFAELYQVDGASRAATGSGRCRIAFVEVLL